MVVECFEFVGVADQDDAEAKKHGEQHDPEERGAGAGPPAAESAQGLRRADTGIGHAEWSVYRASASKILKRRERRERSQRTQTIEPPKTLSARRILARGYFESPIWAHGRRRYVALH